MAWKPDRSEEAMMDLRQRLDEAILRGYGLVEQPLTKTPGAKSIQRRIAEAGLLEDGRLQDITDWNHDRGVWIAATAPQSPIPNFCFSAVGPFYCLLDDSRLLESPVLAPDAARVLAPFLLLLGRPEFVPGSLLGKRSPLVWMDEPQSYFAALFYETDVYNDPAEFTGGGVRRRLKAPARTQRRRGRGLQRPQVDLPRYVVMAGGGPLPHAPFDDHRAAAELRALGSAEVEVAVGRGPGQGPFRFPRGPDQADVFGHHPSRRDDEIGAADEGASAQLNTSCSPATADRLSQGVGRRQPVAEEQGRVEFNPPRRVGCSRCSRRQRGCRISSPAGPGAAVRPARWVHELALTAPRGSCGSGPIRPAGMRLSVIRTDPRRGGTSPHMASRSLPMRRVTTSPVGCHS